MYHRNQSATNLNYSYGSPKNINSSYYIDSTSTSIDNEQIEIESIISGLNKIAYRIHLLPQYSIDRLEQTITSFYNQCLLPLKGSLKKQPSTPHLQQNLRDKKTSISSVNEVKNLQLQVQMLKIKKMKFEAQQNELKKKNLHQLNSIQAQYISKDKPLRLHIGLSKFIQVLIKGVQNPIAIQCFIPHIQNIYHQIYKFINQSQLMKRQFKQYFIQMDELILEDEYDQY